MIGRETFGHLDLALKTIMQNLSPFGGVSLLVVGDCLQLPSVYQKGVFMKPSKGSYKLFNGSLWEKFQLHELLVMSDRAMIRILLSFLIGFEKDSKQTMMCFKSKL